MRIFGFIFATMVAYSSQVSAATVQLPVSDAMPTPDSLRLLRVLMSRTLLLAPFLNLPHGCCCSALALSASPVIAAQRQRDTKFAEMRSFSESIQFQVWAAFILYKTPALPFQ